MKNIYLIPTKNYKQDYTLQNGEVVEVVKLGQLILNKETGELLVNKSTQWAASCDTDVLVPHHIYITSDEEIKVSDCYLTFTNKEVMGQPRKCEDANWDFSFCKKIILTTDSDLIKDGVQPIDDEFLEWFVKNPSCEFVKIINNETGNYREFDSAPNLLYKIIIPQEEPKQIKCYCGHTTYCDCGPLEVSDEAKQRAANYMSLKGALESKQETTLEEAAQKFVANTRLKNPISLFCEGAKYQAERMYSEKDLRQAYTVGKHGGVNQTYYDFDEWFEKFKQK